MSTACIITSMYTLQFTCLIPEKLKHLFLSKSVQHSNNVCGHATPVDSDVSWTSYEKRDMQVPCFSWTATVMRLAAWSGNCSLRRVLHTQKVNSWTSHITVISSEKLAWRTAFPPNSYVCFPSWTLKSQLLTDSIQHLLLTCRLSLVRYGTHSLAL